MTDTKRSKSEPSRVTFTKTNLERLAKNPPTKAEAGGSGYITYCDTKLPGYVLRIRPSGTVTLLAQARNMGVGETVRVKLGNFPTLSADEARGAAKTALGRIAAGEDVRADKDAARDVDNPTLQTVWDHYKTNHLEKHGKDKGGTMASLWKCHVKPKFGARKLSKITPNAVGDWHMKIGDKSPTQANRAVRLLRRLYNWSAKPKTFRYLGINPAAGLDAEDWYTEPPRERDLSAAEQTRFFSTLASYENRDLRDIIWLAVVTGQRKGNVLAARWVDVDTDGALWKIDRSTTKTHRTHYVALDDIAVKLLTRRQREQHPRSEWVFPEANSASGHIFNIDKRWRAFLKVAKINDFRFHDLRALFSTEAQNAGVGQTIVQGQLGHAEGSKVTTKHYTTIRHKAKLAAVNTTADAFLKAAGLKAEDLAS